MNRRPQNGNRTRPGAGRGIGYPGGRALVVLVAGSILVAISVGSVAGHAASVTTTIDFEDFDDGTELTGQYEDRGVVFEPQEGESAGAIVERCATGERDCTSAASGTHAIVTPVDFEFEREPLVVLFTERQQVVSLVIREAEWVQGSFRAVMIARDDRGTVVGRNGSVFESDTGWHPLRVEAGSASIAWVEVTLARSAERSPSNYFVVDDLAFGVNVPPTAEFEFSPSSPSTADTVSFTDASSDPEGGIASWRWDFGDGNESTSRSPNHSYGDDGVYTVTLTVTDDGGATDSFETTVAVSNVAPTASFEPNCSGDTCDFDASGSSDPDGTIRYYVWNFGDGNVTNDTVPLVHHTYRTGGTHAVTLTVIDDDGLKNETERTISPRSVPLIPLPLAVTAGVATLLVFGYAAVSGALGAFTGSSSSPPPPRGGTEGGTQRRADEDEAGEETEDEEREDDRSSGPIRVDRVGVREPGDDDLNHEYVSLRNDGDEPYDFGGATVSDGHGNAYTVPSGTVLDPGETVTLYTGDGTDRAGELYWNADGGVWDRTTDRVVVRDANGNVLDEGYYE